jgi:hypothetical protein
MEEGHAELRRVDATTGDVLESVAMPDMFISGLEYDGKDRFYAGGGKSGRLRVIRRPNPRRPPSADRRPKR